MVEFQVIIELMIKRILNRRAWVVPVVAGLLMAGSLFGMVMIFGPAVMAEAGYQVKSVARALGAEDGDWRRLVMPDFRVVLRPEDVVADFGIVIPKIFVSEKVVFNVDPTDREAYTPALREGIAHAAGTGLPGDGQLGYYFAHSSDVSLAASRLNAVFYLLGKLEEEDKVYIWREGERFEYRVVERLITEADDLSFLRPQTDKERIALQTCWPVGTSLRRLIVVAELVN